MYCIGVNERTANERYESERVERVSATSEAFRPIRERLNVVKERYTCEHITFWLVRTMSGFACEALHFMWAEPIVGLNIFSLVENRYTRPLLGLILDLW